MNYLFQGCSLIRAYIDDLLVLPKGYWTDNVHILGITLNKLKVKLIKYSIGKSFFRKTEM